MKSQKKQYIGIINRVALCLCTLMVFSCSKDEWVTPSTSTVSICFSIKEDMTSRSAGLSPDDYFIIHDTADTDSLFVNTTTEYGITSAHTPHSRGELIEATGDWSFKVGAYYYAEGATTPTDYFRENASGGLTCGSSGITVSNYYWPHKGKMSFFAVAPVIDGFNVPTASTVATPTFTYQVPTTVTSQKDLMIAQTDLLTEGTVLLSFKHILTAVQFSIGDIPNGTIQSISMTGTDLVTSGTYNANAQEWVWEDENLSSPTYTISEETTGSGLTYTYRDNKKIINEKLLLIPQTVGNGQVTLTVVFNDTDAGKVRTLSGTIDTRQWSISSTTTYTINITPTYDLQFITTQAEIPTKDCHYDIQEITIGTGGRYTGSWKLEIPAECTWATMRECPDWSESNQDLYYQGYWCENDKGTRILSGSRISSSGFKVLVYLYENTNETAQDTRKVTINLYATNNGKEDLVDSRTIHQYEPIWNNGKAYERIEEYNGPFPWGFCWDKNAKVTYSASYVLLRSTLFNLAKRYGWINSNYVSNMEYSWSGNYNRATLYLGNIEPLDDATATSTAGLANTEQLINYEGVADLNNAISLLTSWGLSPSGGDNVTQPANYAARMVLYKNKFTRITQENVSVAELTEDGLQWFLPSKEEVAILKPTACDDDSSNNDQSLSAESDYWTSSAVSNTTDQSYYYTPDGTTGKANRTLTKKIRAARNKPATTP